MMTMIMLMQAKLEKVAQAASEAAARLAEERAAKEAAVAQRKVVNANRLAENKKVQADAEKQRLEVCLAICASAMCQMPRKEFSNRVQRKVEHGSSARPQRALPCRPGPDIKISHQN